MKMVHDEIRKGPWTEQEDLQLACFVSLFGERRWDFIAKVSGLNRTGKSCRLRWVNYLHPGLKRGKMTPQEERLVLELHSRWGNRWSRIARRLPGRTDNEIKNYWRTHMRKKAQERKQAMSPSLSSSHCSSQSGNNHVVDSLPNTQIKEGSLHDKECPGIDLSVRGGESEEEEDAAKGYSMDQIWKEIASLEDESSREVYDKYREDGGNFSYSPMGPSLWDYCADSLWRMEGEEIKMLLPMADHFVSCYEHTTAS